eukprot:TRINITY_DN5761_c0_g1_i4.p1 TRINITY_DN5761_c0_g1~~TRINITY_DN5761_c0_g1_i4.p1  ORF type:complete len:1361 (+),score=318.11 TRINITY_DN5761_c0_g1_i4:375-4457(+)
MGRALLTFATILLCIINLTQSSIITSIVTKPPTEGKRVTFLGRNFSPLGPLTTDEQILTVFQRYSDTRISCTNQVVNNQDSVSCDLAEGSGDIVVFLKGQTTPSFTTSYQTPFIYEAKVSRSSISSGSVVVLSGENFGPKTPNVEFVRDDQVVKCRNKKVIEAHSKVGCELPYGVEAEKNWEVRVTVNDYPSNSLPLTMYSSFRQKDTVKAEKPIEARNFNGNSMSHSKRGSTTGGDDGSGSTNSYTTGDLSTGSTSTSTSVSTGGGTLSTGSTSTTISTGSGDGSGSQGTTTTTTTTTSSSSSSTTTTTTSTSGTASTGASTTTTTTTGGKTVPPPVISQAIISDDGASIIIFFNEATNQGGFSGNFACSSVFSSDFTTTIGGSNAVCYFQDSSTLIVVLGPGATVNVGDIVALTGKNIKASSTIGTSTYSTSSSPIYSSQFPIDPVVIIRGLTRTGPCDDLTVDISASQNSGGRAFTNITWSLVGSGYSSNITAVFQAQMNLPSMTFNHVLLDSAHPLVLQCTLENWFGGVSISGVFTSTKSNTALPVVQVLNKISPAYLIARNTALTLQATASFSSCEGTTVPLSFAWSVSPSISSSLLVGKNTLSLNVPAFSLEIGTTYTFTLTATAPSGSYSSDSINVMSTSVGPYAIVSASAIYSVTDVIVIDGSASLDRDKEPNQPLTYLWDCQNSDGLECDLGSANLTSPKLNIPANTLTADIYTFELVVSAIGQGSSYAGIDVKVVAVNQAPPLVTIAPLTQALFSPSAKLILSGSATPRVSSDSLTLLWSVDSGDLTLSSSILGTSVNSPTLVILADALSPGDYTLRFSATEGSLTGYATVSFSIARPPSGGAVTVTPSTGASFTTAFSFSADSWVGSAYPLSYVFLYTVNSQSFIASSSSLNSIQNNVYITSPSSTSNVQFSGCVMVSDPLGSTSIACTPFVVTPSTLTESQISTATTDRVTQALNNGDAAAAGSFIASAANALAASGTGSSSTVGTLLNLLSTSVNTTTNSGAPVDPALTLINAQALQAISGTTLDDSSTTTLLSLVSSVVSTATPPISQSSANSIFATLSSTAASASVSGSTNSQKSTSDAISSAVSNIYHSMLTGFVCGEDPATSSTDHLATLGFKDCESDTESMSYNKQITPYSARKRSGASLTFTLTPQFYQNLNEVAGGSDYNTVLSVVDNVNSMLNDTGAEDFTGTWVNSATVSLSFTNSGSGLPINLSNISSTPALVTIPVYNDDVYTTTFVPVCLTFDNTNSKWTTTGVTVNSTTTGSVTCLATSLSSSFVISGEKVSTTTASTTTGGEPEKGGNSNVIKIAVPIAVIALVVIIVVAVIIARRNKGRRVNRIDVQRTRDY